jgi:hypothetical protein
LLQRKPANRLGFGGIDELKNHIWLKDFEWDNLIQKKMLSPYIPASGCDNFDAK